MAISQLPTTLFAGIDVGGTNIKLGLIDGQGTTLAEKRFPTDSERGPADAIERIKKYLTAMLESLGQPLGLGHLTAVGLGTPGTMDIRKGMILEPPNLPGWRHFPIQRELAAALSSHVAYTNDANAAAFGEFWIGGGRECSSLVLLTLGTGLGGGLVIDGNLIQGSTGNAAECGHLQVDYAETARICSCGKPGHLEAYASATAVTHRANALADRNPDSQLANLRHRKGSISARDVHDLALADDHQAMELIFEVAEYLARGIAIIAHVVDPPLVVLGGAMDFGGVDSPVGNRFLDRLKTLVKQQTFTQVGRNLRIEFAKLGSSAGWIGAAGFARHVYDSTSSEVSP